MNKKPSNVPVFLIYAGIIHAIGLALLMPMLITLPGPGSGIAPKTVAVDVAIVAAPPAAKVEQDADQTSALAAEPPEAAGPVEAPLEAHGSEAGAGQEADAPSAVANVSPEAQPEGDSTPLATTEAAKTANAGAAKKPVAQRHTTAKPAVRRSAKTPPKIAPFNGALSGLFSPGAPANNRR